MTNTHIILMVLKLFFNRKLKQFLGHNTKGRRRKNDTMNVSKSTTNVLRVKKNRFLQITFFLRCCGVQELFFGGNTKKLKEGK